MKITKEFKVGIFAVLSGVVLFFGAKVLKGQEFFSTSNNYYAVYDNVIGLTVSNPVVMNGYQVGRVKSLELQKDKDNTVLVCFEIDKGLTLNDSTKAMIAQSLLGTVSVVLTIGKSSHTIEDGGYIIGDVEESLSDVIEQKTSPIIKHLDSTLINMSNLLNEETRKSFIATLKNFQKLSDQMTQLLARNQDNIHGITSNLNTVTSQLTETQKELQAAMKTYKAFGDSLNKLELAQTVEKLNITMTQLNSIMDGINKGEGTMGKLIKDDSLYVSLNKTIADLDTILVHFEHNPKYYLKPLGTSPKEDKKKKK
jgi:phospholipid/cholesterol/gamma-HCH transport system substrate-binding protein